MAKINRYDGNVEAFASQADTNKRTTFGTETTGDDTLDGNFTSQFFTGWQIVGPNEQPTLEDFNAAFFTIGQLMAYVHQVGMPEWNGDQEFHNGSVTNRNGAIYVCLTDNHVSATPPEDDSSNWFNATQVGQNIAVFDTAGVTEWPVPAPLQAGLRKARVTLAGAGGAGGAGESGVRIGNEGASGGAAIKLCDLTGMSTVTLTVGEGGGPVTDETGEAGTSTSFGSIFSAEGGEGGKQTSAVVAVPGDGIGGDLNITGNAGSEGAQTGDIRLVPRAGQPSPLGGGRAAGYRSASGVGSYINGQFAGASGAGGITSNTGGAGADGIIIIEW